MDEMENTSMEMENPADQRDAFLDGWDGSDDVMDTDQTGTEADETAADTVDAEDDAEAGSEAEAGEAETPAETQDAEGSQQEAESGESREAAWIIKHNGTELTVRQRDITPELLQKGVDYDRIRGKYDEAKPVMEVFSGLAQANGMSVPDYVRVVRAAMKKAEGLNDEEAERAIALEDREAAVSAREAEQQENEAEESKRSQRVSSDIQEFSTAFPEVFKQAENDPEVIPQSVWEDVRKGLSLTAAYARYAVESANNAVKTAQDQANAAALNQKNSARSAGSMQSAGNNSNKNDPFLEGFGS
jgi:hypothetical protein